MRVAGSLVGGLGRIPERVREVESCGYDAAVSAEIACPVFTVCGPDEASREASRAAIRRVCTYESGEPEAQRALVESVKSA